MGGTVYFDHSRPVTTSDAVIVYSFCSDICVRFLYLCIYQLQVTIEGVAGLTYTSDIAIDDIGFSKNLTCVSAGRNTPPENFEGNVERWTFEEKHNSRDILAHVILDRRDRVRICLS